MKVQKKIDATVIVEATADTMIELFEQLSSLMEILSPGKCGLCGGTTITFRTRWVDELKFHEAVCACGAALGYGTRKARGGHLFPQRKDGDGNAKPNGGWTKWTPTNGD